MVTVLPNQTHFVYPSDLEYRIASLAVMTTVRRCRSACS